MDIYSVIMAGGGGTRFWPLSRQGMPKQLLNISGNDIMINETITRCNGLIDNHQAYIVTNRAQADILDKILLSEVPRKNILVEPMARNTAACIAYAALTLKKLYGDVIMVVLPSDHHISDETGFRKTLAKACDIALQGDKLVTIGIKPTFASTGYGYINFEASGSEALYPAYEVREFVEKPDFNKAKLYVESGNYLWNSGMFIWKTSVILSNFERYLPRLYKNIMELYEFIGTEKEAEMLAEIYPKLQNISIDYGILERSDDVLVIPGDFGWNDVGSWDALGAIFPTDESGNIVKADHVGIKTKNSIIYSTDRLITTIGIDGLIIADTNDALLICRKEDAQEVKNIVDMLKEKGMKKYI